MNALVCGSLFSGVGGMDLGLTRAGFQHAFFCEQDEWRRGILNRHWPGIHVWHDVRDVAVGEPAGRADALPDRTSDHGGRRETGAGLPRRVDLLAGGFPCQDLSVAGRRAGLIDGERSSLFFEFARVADLMVGPGGWVLIENVPGLLSSNSGRDFAVVLATLAELGFHDLAWRVLDARFFGVPQRRRRVFILARRARRGDRARQVLLEPEGGRGDLAPRYPAWAGAAPRVGGGLEVAGSLSRRYRKDVNTTVDDGAVVVSALGTTRGGGHGLNAKKAAGGHIVVGTLQKQGASGGGWRVDAEAAAGGHLVPVAFHMTQDQISESVVSPALGRTTIGMGVMNGAPTVPAEARAVEALRADGIRRLTPTETERLMGWPDGWTTPGSDSRRYAACGDGVVSYVAEWIGRRLAAELNGTLEPREVA